MGIYQRYSIVFVSFLIEEHVRKRRLIMHNETIRLYTDKTAGCQFPRNRKKAPRCFAWELSARKRIHSRRALQNGPSCFLALLNDMHNVVLPSSRRHSVVSGIALESNNYVNG